MACGPGANPWIEEHFHDCVHNWRDYVGFTLGLMAIAFWIFAQLPQFISNFRNKSAEALSPWFLAQWLLGDTFNLTGALMQGQQLPTTTYTAMYFVLSDVFMMMQYIYYGALQHRREKILLLQARYQQRAHRRHRHHHHHRHHRRDDDGGDGGEGGARGRAGRDGRGPAAGGEGGAGGQEGCGGGAGSGGGVSSDPQAGPGISRSQAGGEKWGAPGGDHLHLPVMEGVREPVSDSSRTDNGAGSNSDSGVDSSSEGGGKSSTPAWARSLRGAGPVQGSCGRTAGMQGPGFLRSQGAVAALATVAVLGLVSFAAVPGSPAALHASHTLVPPTSERHLQLAEEGRPLTTGAVAAVGEPGMAQLQQQQQEQQQPGSTLNAQLSSRGSSSYSGVLDSRGSSSVGGGSSAGGSSSGGGAPATTAVTRSGSDGRGAGAETPPPVAATARSRGRSRFSDAGDDDGGDGGGGHPDWMITVGTFLGWVSSFLYLSSRFSQIYKNYTRQSAEGLALAMFMLAVAANTCTGTGMLLRTFTMQELMDQGPWLAGSLGTITLDMIILAQSLKYGAKHTQQLQEQQQQQQQQLGGSGGGGQHDHHHPHHQHQHAQHAHHGGGVVRARRETAGNVDGVDEASIPLLPA